MRETVNIKLATELDVEITNEDFEDDEREASFEVYECSGCHWRFIGECTRYGYGYVSQTVQTPNYCPMCGKKIVDMVEEK